MDVKLLSALVINECKHLIIIYLRQSYLLKIRDICDHISYDWEVIKVIVVCVNN